MNENEFLDLLRTHQGVIYKLVGLYASDEEEKKDLYQEIVLQCWKGIGSFRGDAKFSTWLYRVCLNTIFTARRRRKILVYAEELPEGPSPEADERLQREDVQRLYAAIRQLGETDRAVVLLHLEGYENLEIGELMGMLPNTVAVRLHRIKQRLNTLLKREAHDRA